MNINDALQEQDRLDKHLIEDLKSLCKSFSEVDISKEDFDQALINTVMEWYKER